MGVWVYGCIYGFSGIYQNIYVAIVYSMNHVRYFPACVCLGIIPFFFSQVMNSLVRVLAIDHK